MENNWSSLFVDPLNKFKIWKRHATDMSTRYLRLSLTDPYAAVNEIIIYGYPVFSGYPTQIQIRKKIKNK
jgi:hypothetical protein